MNYIRQLREQKEINRAQLSRLSGVPLRTLEEWEAGRRKPRDVYQLAKVAKVFECAIEDLIDLTDG